MEQINDVTFKYTTTKYRSQLHLSQTIYKNHRNVNRNCFRLYIASSVIVFTIKFM